MKPLFIGYTNPTQESDAEQPQKRQRLLLTDQDLVTHIHGVGATRSGKSKWLEWFCRQLYREGAGFTVIDPQGALARALVDYFAYLRPPRPILYFDPSRSDYLIPFNAFRTSQDEVSKRVGKQVEAMLRVWGAANADQTPRLERRLRDIFYLFATGHITVNEVLELLTWNNVHLREYAVKVLEGNRTIQNEWQELLSYKRSQDFTNQIESAHNRLFRLAENPQIKRIMSLEEKSLDFAAIVEEGAIVIANLSETEVLAQEHARFLGIMMINELWAAVRSRRTPPKRPYFLLVDEVPLFLTPDLKEILDRGAGKGLHLGVFHQHLTQFKEQDAWTFASVMTNAKLKLVFGGLTKEDALLMADNIFPNQISYDEVKFVIEQTKFWPVYGRDTVYTSSRGGGRGKGVSEQTAASAAHAVTTIPDAQGNWQPGPVTDTTVTAAGRGSSESEMENWNEGEADIPIYFFEPFTEVSSQETYSLEEQRNRVADRLMEQYQRHYFLRRPGSNTVAALTPFVKEHRLSPARTEAYILEALITPYALPVPDIDQKLDEQSQRLERVAREAPAPVRKIRNRS